MFYTILIFINILISCNDIGKDRLLEKTYNITNYDLRKGLPKGYVTNGSIDYTGYIQQAITQHDNVQFPGFPLLINDNGLKVGSNKTLYFEKGSEIRLKPSLKKGYNIFDLRNVKNVQLINPVIRGDRYTHLGKIGEWGMGIGIYSSENIKIVNAKIYDCWGDGIYIGKSEGKTNRGIEIIDAICKNNRRDGISVITVNGLLLDSPYAGYSNGTAPMAGINIEPNDPDDEVKNIKIINPKTEHNMGAGILVAVSLLYGKEDKNISVEIENHIDKTSGVGFKTSCYPKRKSGAEEVKGYIVINNPTWIGNLKVPIQTALFQKDLRLKIFKPVILSANGKSMSEMNMRKTLTSKGHINPHANYLITYR
ncbi:MAG: right-handed parallel beta-helix repeat-containing protein [Pyrinomonadaceae bacterium]|nr:right-handed parallel beta-helix repeat-containing protein [Sphingobacteriaceae bacterium]